MTRLLDVNAPMALLWENHEHHVKARSWLPEQLLVLGIGAARRVPSWDASKDRFVPVMEANLTLSFDHRVIDGGAAGRLLMRIADLITHPEQL